LKAELQNPAGRPTRVLIDETIIALFLIKTYHGFKQTIVEINIWTAFETFMLQFDIMQESYGLSFHNKVERKSIPISVSVSVSHFKSSNHSISF
jgi:hypothetical protein